MRCKFYPCEYNSEGFCELDQIEVDDEGRCSSCLELTIYPKEKKKPIAQRDYENIQDNLRRKLSGQYDWTGKRREGYEDGILCAMSVLHSFQNHGG